MLDETKIEEIAKAAKGGASYIATQNLINKLALDAANAVAPIITEMSTQFNKLLTEAAQEAFAEVINEIIGKKITGGESELST